MLLESLLSASLDTFFGLVAQATGVDEALRGLLKTDERLRRAAFDRAYARAREALAEERLAPLLEDRLLNEAVINGLLDPVNGFDLQSLATEWTEKYPGFARPLRRFFDALEKALIGDEHWGPILERYYQLRERRETQAALAEQRLDLAPQAITREVLRTITNTGAGAVGTDQAVVAGQGGTAIRADTIAQLVIQHLVIQSGAAPAQADLRQKYLAYLAGECQRLPVAALGGKSETRPLTLKDVYIDLNTTRRLPAADKAEVSEPGEAGLAAGREQEKTALLPALDAFRLAPRLVLLGGPGAGKSTFAKEVLARVCQGGGGGPCDFADDLLPVWVELRHLAPRLAEVNLAALPGGQHDAALLAQLPTALAAQWPDYLKDFAPALEEALRGGQCLLVLDGLDEVDEAQRPLVRHLVEALLSGPAPMARLLVTCRVRSYVGKARLPACADFTLADFDQNQIQRFAQAWYNAQFTPDSPEAKRRAEDLARAAGEPKTREMASNPMLLTVLAFIHTQDVTLPRERVRVYKRAVEILLEKWQAHKTGEAALDAWLDRRRLRPALERLAYEAHCQKGTDPNAGSASAAADLPRHLAQDVLAEFWSGDGAARAGDADEQAARFLNYVDQRAGLLVGHGGAPGRPAIYAFPHRTFQEYLAAGYLLARSEADRVTEFCARAEEGDRWHVVAQFAMEELFFNDESDGERQLLFLAYNLLPQKLNKAADQRAALWAGMMAALAGCAAIQKDKLPAGGALFLNRQRLALVKLLGGRLTPLERAEAGRALGKLGDPRPEVMTVDAMRFSFVSAGEFTMGSGDDDRDAGSSEKPAHPVTLPAYGMALHPVTNAQYAEFVRAGGYQQAAYWREAGATGRWQAGKVKRTVFIGKGPEDEEAEAPYDFGLPLNLSNHPVVGITWYEALAFTRWLTARWHQHGKLPDGWEVRLPTEAQWEKAARGGAEILDVPHQGGPRQWSDLGMLKLISNSAPQRLYAWGSDFDVNRANVGDTGIGSTTALGCFEKGISPYGCLDMTGNVWEWCQSKQGDYPYQGNDGREDLEGNVIRVLRGGSFYSFRRYVRCACRDWYLPDYGFDNFGFRCVLSPL